MDTTNYEIPSENVPALTARLERAARKAAKVGCPIVFVFGAEIVRMERVGNSDRKRPRSYTALEVSTTRPAFEGWTFLGTLDHVSAAPAIVRRMVPGVTCPAYALEVAPGTCDHCHKARQRSETFVCQNVDGSIKVVGRQCVADFLGQQSAAEIASAMSYILEAVDACEESEGGGGGSARWLDLTLDVLIQAAAVVRVEGAFRPAAFEETSTRSIVSRLMSMGLPRNQEDREFVSRYAVTLADCERAWSALAWLLTQPIDSDFTSNLHAVASVEYASAKNYGYLSALIGSHSRYLGEVAARAVKAPSTHIGQIGKREGFGPGVIERIHAFDGQFGTTHFITIRLDSGPILSWKASNKAEEIQIGARVNVAKATVKAHTEFRGTAQTEISRADLEIL